MRVVVAMGGVSAERDISLRTGEAVAAALAGTGHEVRAIDIRDRAAGELTSGSCDVVFVALHGTFGEDGAFQALLEERGIAYTGSGPDASALAMDNAGSKEAFVRAGVPTPPAESVPPERAVEAAGRLALPVVVKPNAQGSSVGVSIVSREEEMDRAVAAAAAFGGELLIEKFIPGKEVTVAILADEALPIVELRPARDFYDYQAKYEDRRTEYLVDPGSRLPAADQVAGAGVAAHRALGCRDISRVDIIVTASGEPMVLEVNTLPGMTDRSLVPKAAAAAGIDFPALCDRLVMMAAARAGGGGEA